MREWVESKDGSFRRSAPGGRLHVIEQNDDGHSLFTVPATEGRKPMRSADFFWHGEDLTDLTTVAESCDTYWKSHDAARRRAASTISRNLDGLTMTATFERGSFDARLWESGGKRPVGNYFGTLNNAVTGYVFGELTIQGSQFLDDAYHGRGLGSALVDLAEELTGLRAVPHGFMGTTGTLSQMAARSWKGRAVRKPVLGMDGDPAVIARATGIVPSRQREAARLGTDDYRCGLTLASRLGYGLTTVSVIGCSPSLSGFFPEDTEINFAFPTRPDGSVVSLRGLDDLQDAISHNLWVMRMQKLPSECKTDFMAPAQVAAASAEMDRPGGLFFRSSGLEAAEIVMAREDRIAMSRAIDSFSDRPGVQRISI